MLKSARSRAGRRRGGFRRQDAHRECNRPRTVTSAVAPPTSAEMKYVTRPKGNSGAEIESLPNSAQGGIQKEDAAVGRRGVEGSDSYPMSVTRQDREGGSSGKGVAQACTDRLTHPPTSHPIQLNHPPTHSMQLSTAMHRSLSPSPPIRLHPSSSRPHLRRASSAAHLLSARLRSWPLRVRYLRVRRAALLIQSALRSNPLGDVNREGRSKM